MVNLRSEQIAFIKPLLSNGSTCTAAPRQLRRSTLQMTSAVGVAMTMVLDMESAGWGCTIQLTRSLIKLTHSLKDPGWFEPTSL
jgi:hypothetical protein